MCVCTSLYISYAFILCVCVCPILIRLSFIPFCSHFQVFVCSLRARKGMDLHGCGSKEDPGGIEQGENNIPTAH